MTKKIIFTDTFGIDKKYYPIPSQFLLPEWYKKTESYMGGKKGLSGNGTSIGTIKKCIPVFDAISSGYLILLPADIFVSQKNGCPWFEWSNFNLIDFHPNQQASLHPNNKNLPYPKFNNPWSIKTLKGYSCLFTPPKHRDNPFVILDGIVDTDTYSAPVNFPFILKDPKWEGLIEAGTPIAQVFPFKRDAFKMEFGNLSSLKESKNITIKLKSVFFDSYKKNFWNKKQYN